MACSIQVWGGGSRYSKIKLDATAQLIPSLLFASFKGHGVCLPQWPVDYVAFAKDPVSICTAAIVVYAQQFQTGVGSDNILSPSLWYVLLMYLSACCCTSRLDRKSMAGEVVNAKDQNIEKEACITRVSGSGQTLCLPIGAKCILNSIKERCCISHCCSD